MKTISKYIFGGLAAMSLVACADLDLNPLSQGTTGSWFRDQTEIEMSLNDLWRPDFFRIDDPAWDDDWLNRNGTNEFTFGTLTSTSSEPRNRWSAIYKGIARAVKIKEILESGSATGISEATVNQYLGETYFVIGYMYGQLTMYYGDCVFSKETMSLDYAYEAERSPKAEVNAYVYECLDKAAELLPGVSKGQQRPTKGAALGLKARVALFHGDYQIAADACQKVMNSNEYSLHDNYLKLFQATSSPELMFYFQGNHDQKKGFGMFSNVKNLIIRKRGGFSNQCPSLELFCAYTCVDGLPIDKSPLYNPKDPFENRDPRMSYVIQPFKTKYSKDYAEYEASKADNTFPQKYPDYITLGYEYNPSPYATKNYEVSTGKMVLTYDSKAGNQHSVYNGLLLRKYVKDDWKDCGLYNNSSDNVYPYLRYAEVLMTYIEAKNELGSVTQADLDATINKIRERAYKGTGIDYPKVTTGSQADLRKIIRMERRAEFPFESIRYRDLLRWKIAEKSHNKPMYYLNREWAGGANWNGLVEGSNLNLSDGFKTLLKNWDDGNFPIGGIPTIDENGLPDLSEMEAKGYIVTFYKMSFDKDKNYLWPIPADDILVNDKITQNPGY
ncbi:MAG: RagB/SusD family nutrient uptake outer membrane protein [Bacteroidales bacterium]|nr:RagB/SusD family nutrient uptake outer membrane protein [Bacteroidales bacterium]